MKVLPGMYAGQDFTSSGIFTPKSDRFGSGIFASGWSIPKSVYTEPMYVGAQIVPGDMAFFRDALSGFDDLAAKFPGGKLGMAALAGLALYFTVGIPVLGWKAGKARRNPGRRRRRGNRRRVRRNPSVRGASSWSMGHSSAGSPPFYTPFCAAGGCTYKPGHAGRHSNGLRVSKRSLVY